MSPRARRTLPHLREVDQTRDEADAAAAQALLREVDSTITVDPTLEAAADDTGEPGS